MKRYARSLISVVCAFAFSSAFADVELPKILDSGMVLQRNSQVHLCGWADPEESITIQGNWLKRVYKTKANRSGSLKIAIPTKEAGLGHSITNDGKTPDFFEIAGSDKIFHPATAIIDGNTLSVSSPSVQNR